MKKQKLPKQPNKMLKMFKAAILLFIFTFMSQLFFSNKSATRGDELTRLYNKKSALQKEMSKLEYERSTLNSLSYIETEAKKLGFVELREPIALLKSPSVAVAESHNL